MYERQQKPIRRRAIVVVILLLLVLGGFFLMQTGVGSFIYQFFFTKSINLKETPEHKVNILLLGVGGGTHDGPDLTDTIMFASIDPAKKTVTLVSIPRDLWIPDLHAKINTAYTFGEEDHKGGGLQKSKSVVENVLGQQIDYAFKLDFAGFTKAVDMLGGLDITVDRSFDDYQYPIEGKEDASCGHSEQEIIDLSAQIASATASELDAFSCRYEHLHFDKGQAHMDGTTALKFVRSRHAEGPEGSDFARSKRQTKVITAFKQKIFSLGTLLNPVKVINLITLLKDNIDTDISQDEYDDFIRLAQVMKGAKINSYVIDVGDEATDRQGLLINPPISGDVYGRQWVLAPRTGAADYTEIHAYVSCLLKADNCIVGTNGILTPTPTISKNK